MVCKLGVLRDLYYYTHCVADIGIDRNDAFREGLARRLDRHPICDAGSTVYMAK